MLSDSHEYACRGTLQPDPRYDAARCIIMAVFDDDEDVPDGKFSTRLLQYDASAPLGTSKASPLPGIQVQFRSFVPQRPDVPLVMGGIDESLRCLAHWHFPEHD